MKIILRILAILLYSSAVSLAYSEYPKLTKSRLSDRLQQPTVTAVFRDSERTLWVGTQQGLYRYDGATLSIFNSAKINKRWIPDSDIRDIAGDNYGNIFVATTRGYVLVWDRVLQTFSPLEKFAITKQSRIVRMFVSKNGYVWVLTHAGLVLYDSKSKKSVNWVEKIDVLMPVGTPQAMSGDKYGNLWVAGNSGIVKINTQDRTVEIIDIYRLNLLKNSSITVMEANNEGNLLIGTNSGQILLWNTTSNGVSATHIFEGKGMVYVSAALQYNDKIVIGTDSGLYIFNEQLSFIKEVHAEDGQTSSTDIYSLFRDDAYIWVGKVNGLDILSFASSALFNFGNNGISNHVLAFTQGEGGRLWIGTYSGLFYFDEESQSHIKYEHNFNSSTTDQNDQRVSALASQPNEIWIGLFGDGVRKLENSGRHFQISPKTILTHAAITKLLADPNNKDVWVATFDQGLFRVRSTTIDSYLDNQRLPEKSITSLFNPSSDIFLALAENRVYQYNRQTDRFIKLSFNFGLGDIQPLIYSVAYTEIGDIIFGTKDYGLFFWSRVSQIEDQTVLNPASSEPLLSTATIYGIEVDSIGNLWCSTQNGVIKVSPEGVLLKRFTTADGLQGNDFTLGASFKSREGLIYFGGTNGYNRFDPDEIEIDDTPSPMRLTAVDIPTLEQRNLGDIAHLSNLQLSHKDRFLSLQFSVLDFIDAERNQFRYMLENFDNSWTQNGNSNTVSFTNLPVGDYVFRAQGANSAGTWNRDGIELNVTVLPAPWFSWWAYTLYGIAACALLWGVHRIYRSYAIDRHSAQLAQEMLEAENRADDNLQEQLELQDELVRSTYQHNLTTLDLVSNFVRLHSGNDPEDTQSAFANHIMKRISALHALENCLRYQAGSPVANLYQYTELILPGLIDRCPVSPETLITINEVSAVALPAETASPVSIVIYELLDNCFQHAFESSSPANYIHISLVPSSSRNQGKEYMELTVHDSGIGMPDTIDNLASEGRGLAIVKLISDKIGGELSIREGNGATIRMIFPTSENA